MSDDESSPEGGESPGVGRRQFLGGLIGGAAAVSLEAVLNPAQALAAEAEPGHIYKSGDVIPTPMPLQFDGWTLVARKADARRYDKQHPWRRLEFEVQGPEQSDVPSLSVSAGDFGGLVSIDPKRLDEALLPLSPTIFDDLSYLITREYSRDDKLLSVQAFALEPQTFRNHKGVDDEFGPDVVAEVDVGEEHIEAVARLLHDFEHFSLVPAVYIYGTKDPTHRGGEFDPTFNRVAISSIVFEKPLFKDEGLAKVFHEQVHGVFEGVLNNEADQRLNIVMFNAYAALVKAAGYELPMPSFSLLGPPAEIEKNSPFTLFDESTYTPPPPKGSISEYGHPYSSHNELFASASTVIRFFPQEFAERFRHLDEKQQALARDVLAAVDQVYSGLTDELAYVARLLPALAELRTL